MNQESKKKLLKGIKKAKEIFIQSGIKRNFQELLKVEPQQMNDEERFLFLEQSIEHLSFELVVEIYDLMSDIRNKSIANNQASRKLNQIILKIQKEV